MQQPYLYSERLCLRPFHLEDATDVQNYAGDYEVAKGVLSIPHPYPVDVAVSWISTHQKKFNEMKSVIYAITDRKTEELIGCAGLNLRKEHKLAELGYWIGREFWNKGIATEAVSILIKYGFQHLNVNRIYAKFFTDNAASARVLDKCGLQYEGTLKQHLIRFKEFKDVSVYAILKSEY